MRGIVLSLLVACGGNGPTATNPHDVTPPSADAGEGVEGVQGIQSDAGIKSSTVRFDDLGISFVVPSGFHVIGDDELNARIRASASPHLQSDLRKHAGEKKGLPLLVLTRDTEPVSVTLSAVIVPADATPMELLTHQQTVMAENLSAFQTTSAPKELSLDNVPGAEMSVRYSDHSRAVASRTRIYVRGALATLVVAVWSDGEQPRADEAARLLDGLHFHDL